MGQSRQGSKTLVSTTWPCVMVAVLLGWAGRLASGEDYAPYTPIGQVSIIGIGTGECWLAGSDHTVTCVPPFDSDCRLATGEIKDDTVTCYWGGSGSFWGNQYIGWVVVYICSDGWGEDSFWVTADDNYYAENYYGEGLDYVNNALADESPTYDMKTVYVAVPWVEEFDFAGTTNYLMKDDKDDPVTIFGSEYNVSLGDNSPACQQRGQPLTLESVKFRAWLDLTKGSNVDVRALGTVNFGPTKDQWGAWDSSGITMTSVNQIVNHVHKYAGDFSLGWSYRCPTGSNNWIGCGSTDHTVYVVLDTPIRDMATPWQKVLDYSCVWAEGTGEWPASLSAIWTKIQSRNATDMKYYGAASATAATTGQLLKDKDGKCGAWGHFFDDVCACQGIVASFATITPRADYSPTISSLVVKNMEFGAEKRPGTRFPYDITDSTWPGGIPGQGAATPARKAFFDHAVNLHDGWIYDPSYGTGPYENVHEWEEAAIKAYGGLGLPLPVGPNYPDEVEVEINSP